MKFKDLLDVLESDEQLRVTLYYDEHKIIFPDDEEDEEDL